MCSSSNEAEWKAKGYPADFAIELCKRHEASDDIYKIFRDKMVPAIMPWKNEERKKHLARNRWTEVVNDRMEAVCVIFIQNYGGKWMGTGAANKWVDGKGKQGQCTLLVRDERQEIGAIIPDGC